MFLLKGLLFLLLYSNNDLVYLCIYGCLACLYLAGAFDFVRLWFENWGQRPQLEAHLVRLRAEQHAGEVRRPPDDRPAPEAAPEGEAQPAPPQVDLRPPPPYWVRWFYQLVVMFVMTMFPWWTPDQRYL